MVPTFNRWRTSFFTWTTMSTPDLFLWSNLERFGSGSTEFTYDQESRRVQGEKGGGLDGNGQVGVWESSCCLWWRGGDRRVGRSRDLGSGECLRIDRGDNFEHITFFSNFARNKHYQLFIFGLLALIGFWIAFSLYTALEWIRISR